MPKFITKISIFVCTLFVCNQSFADYLTTLYDVEILVADEYVKTRTLAFEQGLDEVFVRVSGDSIVMDKLTRPRASRYVKQFSYEPVLEPVINDEGEVLSHRLKVQYNGKLMEKYLLDHGSSLWNKQRPNLVVWLVVRDGINEYVLKDSDESLLKSATSNALTRRGIPERWPHYDIEDKEIIGVADIRGGFKGPIEKASKRYSKGPSLTGSIIWDGNQWQSNWSLLVDSENRHWSLDDTDYKQLINNAIDQAADVMGGIYVSRNSADSLKTTTIQLEVQAVNSIEEYRYIEDYLTLSNVVAKSSPSTIDNQIVTFEVTLRGAEEDFISLINNNTSFSQIQTQPIEVANVNDGSLGNTPVLIEQSPTYRYKLMK